MLGTSLAPALASAQLYDDEDAETTSSSEGSGGRVAISGPSSASASDAGSDGDDEGATSSERENFRVYLISVPLEDGLDAVTQRVGAQGRAALRTIAGAEWQAADQRFLGYDAAATDSLALARTHLQAGREAYLAFELPTAIEELNAAVAAFDGAATALEDPQDLGQSLLLLGAAYAFDGRTRDATRIFARLHTQMPQITPDPNEFPPEVVERFQAARPRDAGSPSGAIHVETDPPGSIAFVDFVARGVTPLDVGGLIGGDHVVRMTRVGGTPAVQPVTVRGRRPVATSAMLFDDENAAGLADAVEAVRSAPADTLPADHPLRQVAAILELERIAVVRTSAGSSADEVHLELVVWDIATGRRLVRGEGTAPTAVGALEPAVNQLVSGALDRALAIPHRMQSRVVEREPELRRDAPEREHHDDGGGRSIVEEPVFWLVVGGVVLAGAAVAVGVAVASGSGEDSQGGQVILTF